MWVVIHLASGKEQADRTFDLLTREGILVKQKPLYKNVNPAENLFQIAVLQSEAEEARQILLENSM